MQEIVMEKLQIDKKILFLLVKRWIKLVILINKKQIEGLEKEILI